MPQSTVGPSFVHTTGVVVIINCHLEVYLKYSPEGPSTQHLRLLVPRTIPFMVFGTRVL